MHAQNKDNNRCTRCHTGRIVTDGDVASCLDCGSYHSSEHRPGPMLNRVSAAAVPIFAGIRNREAIPRLILSPTGGLTTL